jgi:hypothetical protein
MWSHGLPPGLAAVSIHVVIVSIVVIMMRRIGGDVHDDDDDDEDDDDEDDDDDDDDDEDDDDNNDDRNGNARTRQEADATNTITHGVLIITVNTTKAEGDGHEVLRPCLVALWC